MPVSFITVKPPIVPSAPTIAVVRMSWALTLRTVTRFADWKMIPL